MEQKKWWNVTYTKSGDLTVLAATEHDAIEAADKLWAEGKRPEWTPSEISDARPVDDDEQVDAWIDYVNNAVGDELDKGKADIDALFYPITNHFELDELELLAKGYVADLIGIWSDFGERIYAKHARRLMGAFARIIACNHVYGEREMLENYKTELVKYDSLGDIAEAACAIDIETAGDDIYRLAHTLVDLVAAITPPHDNYEEDLITKVHSEVDTMSTASEAIRQYRRRSVPLILIRLMKAIEEHRSSARR